MSSVLKLFMGLAVVGFGASVVVHFASIFGLPNPLGPYVWGLHFGIFIVWIPAVLVSFRLASGAPRREFWKVALRGCPPWVTTGLYVVGGYTVINFAFFMVMAMLGRDREEAVAVRGFSGHWLLFYYAAAAILYSASRLGSLGPSVCPHGHEVSPFARFCEQCGARVTPAALG